MWNVNPKVMCNQHLLGEHVETHMFAGTINRGISIKGYVEKGLVEVHNLRKRHDELVSEMLSRGMKHQSILPTFTEEILGKVDSVGNVKEMAKRCIKCGKLQEKYSV